MAQAPAWDQEVRHTAQWVLDTIAPAYGPHGGYGLLAEPMELHDSAALLRDLPSTHPGLAVYRRLVTGVHQAVGDQGALALLLAAGIVEHAHRSMDDGIPRAALLDGLRLARRQSMAWLQAHAADKGPSTALTSIHPDWAEAVLPGLRALAEAGRVHLDHVDIRAEAGPAWSDGLRLELHGDGARRAARVLMLHEGPRRKPRTDAVLRAPGHAAEAAIDAAWLARLDTLGVDVVLAATSLGDLRDRIAQARLVADDLPRDARRRIEALTGAQPVGRIEDASTMDLGVADLDKAPHRQGGWHMHGPGPGATFCIGAHPDILAGLHHDRAERFLRAAGVVLVDARALLGGGAWQAGLADALAQTADHAPGKAAYGFRVLARALDGVVMALRRNAGLDPMDGVLPHDVHDSAAAVEHALGAAVDVALQLLRIDGRHSKRASQGVDLRGGTGKAGSPRGMPGDIPPLM